jgi:hypothetical protein
MGWDGMGWDGMGWDVRYMASTRVLRVLRLGLCDLRCYRS